MTTIRSSMTQNHRHCDELFATAEAAVARGDWPRAQDMTRAFAEATLRHFAHEETVLFPAFEKTTGMTEGPTVVMRHEHEQLRDMLQTLQLAVAHHDTARFLGMTDTLLIYMQQHNMKEENVLYPMIDQHCGAQNLLLPDNGSAAA
jgi:hemerythrin-like domain-containing protein